MVKSKFPRTATLSEFTNVQTDVKANTFQKIYEYVVPAQQGIRYGKGAIVNGVDDRGTLILVLKDNNGNAISGWVRLAYVDANEINKRVVMEERTEVLEAGLPLGETPPGVKEDSKLIIEFKPDSDAKISPVKSKGQIPLTIYTL